MSKLVIPLPPPVWKEEQIPDKACWWRHAMTDKSPHDYLYMVTRGPCKHDNCSLDCSDAKWVTIDWYDGLDILIDAGMDLPTVWAICITHIESIEYIDLLSEHRPTESFYRITEYGDQIHPDRRVMPDLDWELND